jgi:hypothetical protein
MASLQALQYLNVSFVATILSVPSCPIEAVGESMKSFEQEDDEMTMKEKTTTMMVMMVMMKAMTRKRWDELKEDHDMGLPW